MEEELKPDAVTETPETTEAPKVNIILARMKAKYPDKEDMDEDGAYSLADQHISELEDYRTRNTEVNDKLDKILRMHPELVRIIQDLDAGASFEEAIARNVDVESLKPMEDDPDYEKWESAKAERLAKMEEGASFEAKLAENKAKSQQNLRDFADENGLTPEAAMSFVETTVAPLLDKIATLDFDKSFLQMLYKSVTHEQDVKAAEETGMLKGKNAKAEEIMQDAPVGDGLPKAESAMVSAEPPAPKKLSYIERLKQSR